MIGMTNLEKGSHETIRFTVSAKMVSCLFFHADRACISRIIMMVGAMFIVIGPFLPTAMSRDDRNRDKHRHHRR